MAQITSFIRWAGGKSWLVPYIKEIVNGFEFNNYFEPFMGGASIFFAINTPGKCFLSDVNEDLVNAFSAIRDDHKKVISFLNNYTNDEESYYRIRGSEVTDKYEKAARFLYLNANSYNGLYRVNKSGKYNVPYGKRNVPVNLERLEEVSVRLQGVEISCHDFEVSKEKIAKGDLVFLDPPYTVSKENNGFIAYNSTLFSLDDQYRLGGLIDYINQQGAYFILTNAAHEKILEIFEHKGRLVTLERSSLIGGKNAYRGKVQEYIFTNIPERGSEDVKD
jgi:DNA adenine methylase